VKEDKDIGPFAKILIGNSADGHSSDLVLHRLIGFDPNVADTDWVLSSSSQIESLKAGAENPFLSKTRIAIAKVRNTMLLKAGLLKEDDRQSLLYPASGNKRDDVREVALELLTAHKAIHGHHLLGGWVAYVADEDDRKAESKISLFLKTDKGYQDKKAELSAAAESYVTTSGVEQTRQMSVPYLKGLSTRDAQKALSEMMRTGKVSDTFKSLREDEKPKRALISDFADFGMNLPIDAGVKRVFGKIHEYAELRKEWSSLIPRGKEAERAETAENKAARTAMKESLDRLGAGINDDVKAFKALPSLPPPK
jgi:hypothetical protein